MLTKGAQTKFFGHVNGSVLIFYTRIVEEMKSFTINVLWNKKDRDVVFLDSIRESANFVTISDQLIRWIQIRNGSYKALIRGERERVTSLLMLMWVSLQKFSISNNIFVIEMFILQQKWEKLVFESPCVCKYAKKYCYVFKSNRCADYKSSSLRRSVCRDLFASLPEATKTCLNILINSSREK